MHFHCPVRFAKVHALALGVLGLSMLVCPVGSGHAAEGVRLSGNHPAQAEAFSSLGGAALDSPLQMQIRFAVRNRAALDQLLEDQQNPDSARYHQWLKTGEFAARFGPSSSEVSAL